MESQDKNHSTLGSVAALIEQTLRYYKCEPAALFRSAGIDIERITDPAARFPVTQMQKLWRHAVDETGDPCFGLTAGELLQPAALHGLGLAWLASDTLRDGLARLTRFSRLISTAATVQFEETDNSVNLTLLPPADFENFAYEAVDAGMAFFLRMCRITGGPEISPVHVALMRPRPACADRFTVFFNAPIEYGADTNLLSFNRDRVSINLPYANPELARINDQSVVDYLARFDRDSITMRVRATIIERLPDGTPSQGNIAETLHVSMRSLQRKLNRENTNFKELLEGTRHELALQYIREQHRSIGEITYLLGFSEPSNFSRAFKRWTGMSPAEYRESA